MNANGQSDARADRVSDAGLWQLVRYLRRRSWGARCLGKLAVERHACQVLRDQLPVVFDRTGADNAVALDELQVQAALVICTSQPDAVAIPAQRAERALVYQMDEKVRKLDLPVRASPHVLLGRGQLSVKAPPVLGANRVRFIRRDG